MWNKSFLLQWEKLEPLFYCYCLKHTSYNHYDAEDLLSDCFLKASQKYNDEIKCFKLWIYKIIRNSWIDITRKNEKIYFNNFKIYNTKETTSFYDTEEYINNKAHLDKISNILKTISNTLLITFYLRIKEELSYQNIGFLLETTPEAARKRVEIVRKKIKSKTMEYTK